MEAVGSRKLARIMGTAKHYMLTHGYGEDTYCRVDVIAITGDETVHYKNVTGY